VGDGATGGLIGSHNSWQETPGGTDNPILRYSYANVQVSSSGTGTVDKFGGLAGCCQKGTIQNCYARGSVTVTPVSGQLNQRIGGLAGCNIMRGEIVNSYSTGAVSAIGCTLIGGLLGNREFGGNAGVVTNSFYDTTTSGQSDNDGRGVPKTTSEMQTISTFTSAGWDFIDESANGKLDIWSIAGSNYPILHNIPEFHHFLLPIFAIFGLVIVSRKRRYHHG
jgi:hypothetical protein